MLVKAPAGKICPMELSRTMITDSDPVMVPDVAYYRRLVAEGSLIVFVEPAAPPAAAQKTSKQKPKGGNS
jgi:hypothetical protein